MEARLWLYGGVSVWQLGSLFITCMRAALAPDLDMYRRRQWKEGVRERQRRSTEAQRGPPPPAAVPYQQQHLLLHSVLAAHRAHANLSPSHTHTHSMTPARRASHRSLLVHIAAKLIEQAPGRVTSNHRCPSRYPSGACISGRGHAFTTYYQPSHTYRLTPRPSADSRARFCCCCCRCRCCCLLPPTLPPQ